MTSTGVRSRYYLLACLALASFSPAFARGGPGGALGSALEGLLQFAIVVGLVAGAICARVLRRMPWKTLVSVFVVVLALAVVLPFVAIFFGIPALVSCAVFASAFYVVSDGISRARAIKSSPTAMDGDLIGDESSSASDVLRWIAATYVFWVAVSLANFELLGFLAIPPLVFFSPGAMGKFLPFLLPPLAVALFVGVFAMAVVVIRHSSSRFVAPFIVNGCVLAAFFVAADAFRYHLMAQSLSAHTPEHLESSSFLTSVLTYRTYGRARHAGFEENGKTYRWSYSEREFVQEPQTVPSREPVIEEVLRFRQVR